MNKHTNAYKFKTIEIISICIVLFYVVLARFGNCLLTMAYERERKMKKKILYISVQMKIQFLYALFYSVEPTMFLVILLLFRPILRWSGDDILNAWYQALETKRNAHAHISCKCFLVFCIVHSKNSQVFDSLFVLFFHKKLVDLNLNSIRIGSLGTELFAVCRISKPSIVFIPQKFHKNNLIWFEFFNWIIYLSNVTFEFIRFGISHRIIEATQPNSRQWKTQNKK